MRRLFELLRWVDRRCESFAPATGCVWCGDDYGIDGECERCADLDARELVFFKPGE